MHLEMQRKVSSEVSKENISLEKTNKISTHLWNGDFIKITKDERGQLTAKVKKTTGEVENIKKIDFKGLNFTKPSESIRLFNLLQKRKENVILYIKDGFNGKEFHVAPKIRGGMDIEDIISPERLGIKLGLAGANAIFSLKNSIEIPKTTHNLRITPSGAKYWTLKKLGNSREYGVLKKNRNEVYKGEVKVLPNGGIQFDGKGTRFYYGDTYCGEFKENKINGEGVFLYWNNDSLKGTFKSNKSFWDTKENTSSFDGIYFSRNGKHAWPFSVVGGLWPKQKWGNRMTING